MEENRVEKAVELFKSGYNCAQSVVAAYADLFGMDRETALKVSASFGGGMGRMREICGAVSGMFILNGLANGQTDPADKESKALNYAKVQQLAQDFRQANGSIVCRELLAGTGEAPSSDPLHPSERTQAFYRKRPCSEYVRCCAQLVEKELLSNLE